MKTIYDLEKIFRDIQSYIRLKFEEYEMLNDINISSDEWERLEGGGGITHVIADGEVFDNCAINFSSIYGKELPSSALAKSLNTNLKNSYQAMGISVIAHPKNPHIPTSHMNVRLFCMLNKNNDIEDWWIGGGYDLTPFIPYEQDVIEWHKNAKALLQPHGDNLYKEFSENCNRYFNIPHRKERRGVGGIFFDNFKNFDSIQDAVDFLQKVAVSYTASYSNIVDKRKDSKFDDIQKDFQLIRRGRYVEFNLVYDRGTSFGLQSNGRIESIMASLPACAKWSYKKSDEFKLLERSLLKFINRDWNV